MKLLGFDLETAGKEPAYALQPFRCLTGDAWITAASVTSGEKKLGWLFPKPDQIRAIILSAIKSDSYLLGWNVAFDAAFCIAIGLETEVFAAKWLDAMLLWRHAVVMPEDVPQYKRKKYALEEAMKEFYPTHAGFKEFTNFQTTDTEELKQLLHRNREDTYWAVKLAEKFWEMLSPAQQTAALIEARCIPLMAKSKVIGLYADRQAAQELSGNLDKEYKELYEALSKTAPEIKGVNLSSTPQLQKLIYDDWGLEATRFSKKTGKPSTDKYALYDLAAIDDRVYEFKKLREAKNNRKKYATGTLKSLDYNGDGYVRPQGKIYSTYTGRITYGSSDKGEVEVVKETKTKGITRTTKKVQFPTGIALHQWKRGADYRNIILAPPGYGLAEFDAAGQEFRWMAVKSGDSTMLSLCAPGEDPHGYMGAQVAEVDYRELIRRVAEEDPEAEAQRKLGKFCNLSYQYRVSARTATTKARVEWEMDVDEFFIAGTQARYKRTYPGVGGMPHERCGGYWGKQIQLCKQLGYAETVAGRRVQLKGNWVGKQAWALESTAINFPIQGTGADQKYLALAVARNLLPKFGGYFYYELHDGLFFIFPLDKLEKAASVFLKEMSNLPYKAAWGVDLPIKFPFDAKIGPSWGKLKTFKE